MELVMRLLCDRRPGRISQITTSTTAASNPPPTKINRRVPEPESWFVAATTGEFVIVGASGVSIFAVGGVTGFVAG